MARCGLAVAEAYRRLGRVTEADAAWKASYRAARAAEDVGAMAWALWSGGTLARQRGSLALAYRLLGLAAELGERGGDVVVRGYSLAGLARPGASRATTRPSANCTNNCWPRPAGGARPGTRSGHWKA